ncbi:LysR family transcriptional regulator [Streptomyces sp. NPDC056501]|uniref:LysR family transcriptional regulator n=1 Tax=Streptomyces sp. NPDC056501 TaxID=3345841 RepID=UPI0036B1DEC0
MLERLEMEAFLTLAEELHFGRTAERLHVTTGRISQTIKKLERRIGAPLFLRTNRSVSLTPLGHCLYEDVRPGYEQIQAGLDRAISSARPTAGELRVGFVGAAPGQVAHQAQQLFPARMPGWRGHLREVQVVDAVARLREGDVDVLFLPLPVPGPDLVIGPLIISEPRVLVAPADHPLARRKSVSMEDLADIPLLRVVGVKPGDWISDRRPDRTPQGRPIPAGPEYETSLEALQLIASGCGGSIAGAQVTRFYARPGIAYIPLTDAPPLDWAPVWLKSNNTPAVRAFAQSAQEAAGRVSPAASY